MDINIQIQHQVLKQCFEEHLTTTDRLRKYVIPSDNVQKDNIVLLDDTVIVKINGDLRIAVMK